MSVPMGVTTSAGGSLYVTCYYALRVMRFDNASGLGANAPASAVLGQPDFTTAAAGTTGVATGTKIGLAVVAVLVSDDDRIQVSRFQSETRNPGSDFTWPEAAVEQDPRAVGFDEKGVALAARAE